MASGAVLATVGALALESAQEATSAAAEAWEIHVEYVIRLNRRCSHDLDYYHDWTKEITKGDV